MQRQDKAYKLRTGQMKLPVRVIVPYKPPVVTPRKEIEVLPDEPVLGETYMCNGYKLRCIKYYRCSQCFLHPSCERKGGAIIKCFKERRADNQSIALVLTE